MDLKINPLIVETVKTTAVSKAILAAAQIASPKVVLAAQRLFQAADFLEQLFGTYMDQPNALMGGATPRQALEVARLIQSANPSRKNLWFIRLADPNPPAEVILGGSNLVHTHLLDLLALDVSYAPSTLVGDRVAAGSAVLDKVTGREPVELQLTTLDDERGTLKRWFDGKVSQAANADGTFGLPSEYCVDIEIVHGVPAAEIPQAALAYKFMARMRPVSIQHEASRRDEAFQELQMSFTQFDTFAGVR